MKRIWTLLPILGLVAGFGACGSDDEETRDDGTDGTSSSTDDAGTDSESGEGEGEGEMQGGCDKVPAFFDEAGGYVINHPSGKIIDYTGFDGLVEGHASADAVMNMRLWSGLGANLAPGTIDLGGDNASFETCSTCLRFSQGVTMKNGVQQSAEHEFMPVSGKLTIEELNPKIGEVFKFQLDAEMVEVTIDDTTYVTTPVADGCSFSFVGFVTTTTLK